MDIESGLLGASAEVLTEHADRHPCRDSAEAVELICPCGCAVVICCGVCKQPMFVALLFGAVCDHAQALLSGRDEAPPG